MEILLIILSILLLSVGIIFSVLPPLPGPLLSFGALVTTHFISNETQFSETFLAILGLGTVAIIIADYALPLAATKKFGGTKAGIIGGFIGTIAGVILPIPFGIIIGPLLGTIIGDLYGGNHFKMAIKSGFGSFAGFLLATFIKVIFSIALGVIIIWKVGGITIAVITSWF